VTDQQHQSAVQAVPGACAELAALAQPAHASVPGAFIEALEEGQAITAAHAAVTAAVQTEFGITALVDECRGARVVDLEEYQPVRRRMRGTMETTSIQSFADYAEHHSDGAAVFVDGSTMRATAVLNLGDPGTPGHADNVARLSLRKMAAFDALLTVNGRQQSQKALVEFLEDWGPLVQAKYFRGDTEVSPGLAVAALRDITIDSARKANSQVEQLSVARTTFERIQADGNAHTPTFIYWTCQPYAELAARTFVLRLSILTGNESLGLNLRIQNLEQHTEEMGQELVDLVRNVIGDRIPVAQGTYTRGE
jgi:uncharacterized protein YfdQ (DUF2303 family)